MNFDFNPNTREFSFKNASVLVEASELAYKSRAEYKKILKEQWEFSDVYPLDKNETQGFVAKKENMILIAFRGTEETKDEDKFTDMLACQTKTELGKVHYGFLRALKAVWKDVLTAVKNYQDNNQPAGVPGTGMNPHCFAPPRFANADLSGGTGAKQRCGDWQRWRGTGGMTSLYLY